MYGKTMCNDSDDRFSFDPSAILHVLNYPSSNHHPIHLRRIRGRGTARRAGRDGRDQWLARSTAMTLALQPSAITLQSLDQGLLLGFVYIDS